MILIGLYFQLIFILLLKENALDMLLGWLLSFLFFAIIYSVQTMYEWTLSCAEGGKSPLEFKEKHVGLKFGQFLSSYLFCVCNCIRKEKSSLYEKSYELSSHKCTLAFISGLWQVARVRIKIPIMATAVLRVLFIEFIMVHFFSKTDFIKLVEPFLFCQYFKL